MKSKASKPTEPFRFKQFSVQHDRCAMRITLDAVLFGAWIDAFGDTSCIDVGTGSGLLALMLAQRFQGLKVTGIEIDKASAKQAVENMRRSPFSDRLAVHTGAIQEYQPEGQIDHLISNPPFFSEESLLAPDRRRAAARSEGKLTLQELANTANRLVKDGGKCSVLWPSDRLEELNGVMSQAGFFLSRQLSVQVNANKPAHRCFQEWVKGIEQDVSTERLVVQERGSYSAAYVELVRDFYLNF